MIENHCNYTPENWRLAAKGMQPGGFLDDKISNSCSEIWQDARSDAIFRANLLLENGVAKEQINRLLEPFMYIKVLVTSTKWDNFFLLRTHKDAQYEIRVLAESMEAALLASRPTLTYYHLPYIKRTSVQTLDILDSVSNLFKISVARCARVSYATHDGKLSLEEKDLELYDKLITSKPIHASPAEHQVMSWPAYYARVKAGKLRALSITKLNGNFDPVLFNIEN